MKEASSQSPFAALNAKEQKEQWIWWQCQHPVNEAVKTDIEPTSLPELRLPGEPEKTGEQEAVRPSAPQAPMAARIHHGQYDAVVRRMNSARRQATTYIPWTE